MNGYLAVMSSIQAPVKLFSPDYFRAPYPVLDWLRQNSPVHEFEFPVGNVPMWILTRYDDVRDVLTDLRFSSSPSRANEQFRHSGLSFDQDPVIRETVTMADPPKHTRIRRCAMAAFTPRRVESWLDDIHESVDSYTRDWRPGLTVELVADLTGPVSAEVIGKQLGYELGRREEVARDIEIVYTTDPALMAEVPAAMARLSGYGRELVDTKRVKPGEDLTSIFIQARDEEGRLTENELAALVGVIIAAGVGTTRYFIPSSMVALFDHAEQMALLKGQPELLDSTAMEEFLRYVPALASTAWRFPVETVTIRGTVIPAGAPIIPMIAAANRDPEVFPDPHRLDLLRSGPRHFGLGHGLHNCMGAAVARLISKVVIATLIDRFPDIRLAVPREELKLQELWGNTNGLVAVPVVL